MLGRSRYLAMAIAATLVSAAAPEPKKVDAKPDPVKPPTFNDMTRAEKRRLLRDQRKQQRYKR